MNLYISGMLGGLSAAFFALWRSDKGKRGIMLFTGETSGRVCRAGINFISFCVPDSEKRERRTLFFTDIYGGACFFACEVAGRGGN